MSGFALNNSPTWIAAAALLVLLLLAAIFKDRIALLFRKLGLEVWTMRRVAFFCGGAALTAHALVYLLPRGVYLAQIASTFALFTVAAAILSLRDKE